MAISNIAGLISIASYVKDLTYGTAEIDLHSYHKSWSMIMLADLHLALIRPFWWLRKKYDANRRPTSSEADQLIEHYNKAMNCFAALGIDLAAQPVSARRLYHMALLYADQENYICPSGARTATLMGFIDSLQLGFVLPPTSQCMSDEFAKEIEGYMALQIWRNHLGLGDIHKEITFKMEKFFKEHPTNSTSGATPTVAS